MIPTTIHTLFFSPTGTSRRIADAIARGLSGNRPEAAQPEATSPAAAPAVRALDLTHTTPGQHCFAADETVVFAVPVYGGHPAPTALRRMEGLRGTGTPAVLTVVYGNRAFERAAAELAAFVSARGFRPVAAAAFVGEHSYSTAAQPIAAGRPDAGDLTCAEAFGAEVRSKLRRDDLRTVDIRELRDVHTPLWPKLRFIGFVLAFLRKQKKSPRPLLPAGDPARCTGCGRCAAICPVEAIARGAETQTDPARCIRCCACVKCCPVEARRFDTPFAEALARNFARRKPPVTLL